jgi:hypothetical protein
MTWRAASARPFVVALCTAAGGSHRLVLEEELRGTSGRVLFNGRYVPAATAAIPCDHASAAGAARAGNRAGGVGGGGDARAAAATMTELTVTLPAPVDPSRPPVGCAWVQAVSDAGPTRQGGAG